MHRNNLLALAASLLALAASTVFAHTVRPAVATAIISDSGAIDLQIRVNAEVILAGIGPEYTDTNASPNAPVYDRLRLLEPAALARAFAAFSPRLLE